MCAFWVARSEHRSSRRIDRYASDHILATHRIEVGDYVFKEAGFFESPRPRDKKTFSEMLDEAWQQHPSALE